MPANTTKRALYAAYQRLVAREAIASREADAAYAIWEAAAARRRALADQATEAHRAWLMAVNDAALVTAAEDIAFNTTPLFTTD